MSEEDVIVLMPEEAGEEIWSAFRKTQIRYQAGAMDISLYLLHAIHSADCLMGWNLHETALRVLASVGPVVLKRDLPLAVAEYTDIRIHVLSLGRRLIEAGMDINSDLTATTSGGVLS